MIAIVETIVWKLPSSHEISYTHSPPWAATPLAWQAIGQREQRVTFVFACVCQW